MYMPLLTLIHEMSEVKSKVLSYCVDWHVEKMFIILMVILFNCQSFLLLFLFGLHMYGKISLEAIEFQEQEEILIVINLHLNIYVFLELVMTF